MSYDENTDLCYCQRCGHGWKAKTNSAPRSCSKCKSKVWNQPRTYAGKWISGTLARRYKPTGRRAKLIKGESCEQNGESSGCKN